MGHCFPGVIWALLWTQGAQAICREFLVLTPGGGMFLGLVPPRDCWIGLEQGK